MITPHLLILLTDLMISLEPPHFPRSEGWGVVSSSTTLAKGVGLKGQIWWCSSYYPNLPAKDLVSDSSRELRTKVEQPV